LNEVLQVERERRVQGEKGLNSKELREQTGRGNSVFACRKEALKILARLANRVWGENFGEKK